MKRKIIGIMLAMILFIPNTVFAASTLVNIDDVVTAFNNSRTISSFDGLLGIKTQMKANKTTNTLDVSVDLDETLTNKFKYTNEYIELDNRNFTPSEENMGQQFLQSVQILGIVDALINLSGFENKTLKENTNPTNYDKYGLTLETEEIILDEENNGITINGSIEYLKYFKISLDKTKIENLVKDYGTDIKEYENPFLDDLKPALGYTSTKNNEITLQICFKDPNISSTYPVYADIYRATSIDGEYIKINSEKIDYSKGMVTFVDRNVESNKTYFYKAIISDSTIESDILTAKALQTTVSTQSVENPKTGISSPFIIIPITITFALLYFILKKKSLFKNI